MTDVLPEEPTPRPSIVCPHCGRRSYAPRDIRERYCGACQTFHDEEEDEDEDDATPDPRQP